jgi:hypothetical protein
MKKVMLSIALFLLLGIAGVQAQSTPVVDQRQENQKERIKGGVKSGELTRAETKKLAKDQRELRRMERRAKADGDVTAKERARLQHKENKNSRAIKRQKNDAQARPRAKN